MADRRNLVLTAAGFAAVLVCLWMIAIDGYARALVDKAVIQSLC